MTNKFILMKPVIGWLVGWLVDSYEWSNSLTLGAEN